MARVGMIVTGKVKDGRREALKELFDTILGPVALENATQQLVVWCADDVDPNAFFVFEIYRDAADMQANATHPAFATYLEKSMPFLAQAPIVSFGTIGFSKGLGG